jgi:hypothetical protein
MAMQECVCAECGAINQVSSETCWRCLEGLHEAQVEPQPEPERATG